ncbi:MAG TPA: ribosome small subunit-dependent GTPase A [Gammaproteobacteria bacterium]|jgi:ribosome biogenesis GTPase|nr:ribosome small subunit-dependent GTPase A [Gammaproteobacteria bacterium]
MPKKQEKSHAPLQIGLVISYYGSTVSVETADGGIIPCHLRRNQELPVVGDEVEWRPEAGGDNGIVAGILPRRSMLARADARGKMKPIAANIDVLVIVMPPPPAFSVQLVDRYLVASELLNIQAALVVNKVDLMSESDLKVLDELVQPYQGVPYPVILSSIISEKGLNDLDKFLSGRRGVLVGPSGAGKSSLIAALGSEEDVKVGEVAATGAGKHTTTATRLYHLRDGGALIDSPGVRDFNLWPVTGAEVLKGFKEFKQYMSGCRFRDCTHAVEPGCAVQQAVMDGRIHPERFKSYQELLKINKKR